MVQLASNQINLEKKIMHGNEFINIPNEILKETINPILDLDQIIQTYISKLNRYNFNSQITENVSLVKTPEQLIQTMKLRDQTLNQIPGFNREFPSPIQGINFDKFDEQSIILQYKKDNEIVGTLRLILDSKLGIPSKSKFDSELEFNKLKDKYSNFKIPISEISRLGVSPNHRGTKIWQELFKANTIISEKLDVGVAVNSMMERTYNALYKKIGMEIIKEIPNYGHINQPCYVTLWNKQRETNYYKKMIMGETL